MAKKKDFDDLPFLKAHKEREVYEKKILKYAERVKRKLDKDKLGSLYKSIFLAKIAKENTEMDHLTMKWMLDHYMGEYIKEAIPVMNKIHARLIENGYGNRNKYDYFNDCEAFYMAKDRPVFVLGKHYGPKYLVMFNEPERIGGNIFVRHIWNRTRKDCIGTVDHATLSYYKKIDFKPRFIDSPRLYGDCRDYGHVLTYEGWLGNPKCDNVHWDIHNHTAFIFELYSLSKQLFEVD